MSTILTKKVFTPSVAKAKEFIINFADSDTIPADDELEQHGLTVGTFSDTRDRYLARRQAIADLETAAKIQAEADAIVVPATIDYANMKLADVGTVAELRDILDRLGNPSQVVSAEKARKHGLAMKANSIRAEALQLLHTTVSNEHRQKIKDKQQRIRDLQQRITNGEPAIARNKLVQELRDNLDSLIRSGRHRDNPGKRQQLENELRQYPGDEVKEGRAAEKVGRVAKKEIASIQASIDKLQSAAIGLNNTDWGS